MPQFPAVIELSQLDGANGFRMPGTFAHSYAGDFVASAGDINGDGFDDIAIGAPTGSGAGIAFVVFGHRGAFDANFDLGAVNGKDGFYFVGGQYSGLVGEAVSGIGDINGDGIDDVFIANASGYDSGSHMGWVVFGSTSDFPESINPQQLNPSTGFTVISSATLNDFSTAASAGGDINGDGVDDFIIGSYTAGNGDVSGAYVVFGEVGLSPFEYDLTNLDGDNGLLFTVPEHEHVYSHVSAGDVNGDGFNDVIVGTRQLTGYGPPSPGHAYVIYGTDSGFAAAVDASELDGTNGFTITGNANYDYAGMAVSMAGDINGDGIADMVIGARGADDKASNAGATYVVFGDEDGFGSTLTLTGLDGTNGFKILGVLAADGAGRAVASDGDFNGDGFDDLLIGASGVDTNGSASGAAYIVFGHAGGFSATPLDLGTLDGTNGVVINGIAAGNGTGRHVSSAGDMNNDGLDDILIGAPFTAPSSTGESYVVFGIAPDEAVQRMGTAASQTLAGGDFNDVLKGMGGDDDLFGNGGRDRLMGGAGADTLHGGKGADDLDGGSGHDIFVYTRASDSTHAQFDAIDGFNFAGDRFDVAAAITGIDAARAGALSQGSFDADLAGIADATHLGAGHAVLVKADDGDFDGRTFIVIDLNDTEGYQAGRDLVIALGDAKHLGAIDTADFI